MRYSLVTLFPNLIHPYFSDSILKRAVDSGYLSYECINPREFSTNRHHKVDDYLVGGGAGLLLEAEPLKQAILSIKTADMRTVFLLPAGKPFRQQDAERLASEKHLCLVCGRYEGIDERVIEMLADELFSVGEAILTGGELPALMVCDSVARQIPGVLGNEDSLSGESFENGLLEPPPFTKPNIWQENSVPSEFLKGNHNKIADLKFRMAAAKTRFHRPDLYLAHSSNHPS